MNSKTYRLDRFISQHSSYSLKEVHLLIAQERILLDGIAATSVQESVTQFTEVFLDGNCLQKKEAVYLVLNKPAGIVSATRDEKHETVLSLIDHPTKSELHIAGRLDLNSTGMVLLTNDGLWSRRLSLPESKVVKVYEVTVASPLSSDYVLAFKNGIYFSYENITTQPAQLEILSTYCARLSLTEGKYHQVKRMFGKFQNEVIALHRVSIGNIQLGELELGQCRQLTSAELDAMEAAA